jgi:hypothetical protein
MLRAGSVERSPIFGAPAAVKAQNLRAITETLRANAEVWAKPATPQDRNRLAKLIAIAREKAGNAQSSDNLRAMLGEKN